MTSRHTRIGDAADRAAAAAMRRHTFVLVIAALVVASAVAGLGGYAAERADAAKASAAKDKVKAKIKDGVLTVTGTGGADSIALTLAAGDSTMLLVEAGGDTSSFKRDKFTAIVVDAGNGDDVLTIDETHGAFTDTETTTLNGEKGNDTLLGGSSA
jgi:Ca2+-binding RTX toxin-like protein